MSINSVLADAFARAHRRPGAIVMDLLWKVIWLIVTAVMLGMAAAWIYWEIGSVQVQAPAGAVRNPIALMVLARQIWSQYAGMFIAMIGFVVTVSVVCWIFLESYFRSGVLPDEDGRFSEIAARHFKPFIASSAVKQVVLIPFSILMLLIVFGQYLRTPIHEWPAQWSDSSGATLIAGSLVLAIWFVLTVFETLLRINALDVLGRDLFTVTGVIGTLVLFEAMLIGSGAGLGIIALSLVSGITGAGLLLIAVFAAIVFLSIVHSYLLVVRYSAIAVLGNTSRV